MFVPFVSVTERERERKSLRQEECEGMFVCWRWVRLRGALEKRPGGQEVVDESGGRDWWARTGQGRSKRTATEMTSETKL